MTRIVAGTAGGRTLQVPGAGTRPTSDRVREALFSRLEHQGIVVGANVLDLYAGSGAVGLEAASRGAEHVTLVESSKDAVEVVRHNAANLGFADQVTVVGAKAERFVKDISPDPWDLVLLDPPYDLDDTELATVLAGVVPSLAPHAVVVVERSARTPEPEWPAGLVELGGRTYGDTAVWFARTRLPGDD
ncbi:MAG: 16S rRNA (guanine(966)-N(2))-methyltransferase RsmD [Actinomycetales bacterium]|nr:16S rRNA (guanine(966)-N(2))-methyltransferase RsmD [Actinomycetales bacterium]